MFTNRHSYLLSGLSCIKDVNTSVMSRAMDKELSIHTKYRNLKPFSANLASSMPVSFSPNVDATRSKLAFGRWALPRLKKRIHHDDIFVVMQTLNSINDLVYDPEKGFEAVRIGLIDRLEDMMLHKKDFIREKICMILQVLAGLEAGRKAILRRYKILHNLAMLIEDKVDAVRHKAQLALEMISISPATVNCLNFADFMVLLLRLINGSPKTENDDILTLHLATLKMLLLRDSKIVALRHNAMNILLDKIDHPRETIRMLALDCIALLCQEPEGRIEAVHKNLGFILCKKLFDPSMDVKVKVVGALAFATIKSNARNELCKQCTIDNLMQVLENFHSSEGQLAAAKVLGNLLEDPVGKPLVKGLRKKIKNVFTNNDEQVDRHKQILLNLIKSH